jgi:putative endonuclease
MEKNFYVYILASRRNGTLYVGVTSDLIKRVWEHKNKLVEGFTEHYDVNNLVYYEHFSDAENAIRREKRLKKYNRKWKTDLIEKANPEWKDLYEELTSGSPDQVGG